MPKYTPREAERVSDRVKKLALDERVKKTQS